MKYMELKMGHLYSSLILSQEINYLKNGHICFYSIPLHECVIVYLINPFLFDIYIVCSSFAIQNSAGLYILNTNL